MRTFYRSANAIILTAIMSAAAMASAADLPSVTADPGIGQTHRAIGLGVCATLTMTLSVIGAAYAVSRIGVAAMGSAAEKPELLTRSLLFVALAEGLAVLGFAIAIMMIQKI